MKRAHLLSGIILIIVAVAVVVGFAYLQAPPATRVKAGDPVPDLELPSPGQDSGKTRLSSLIQGAPALLVLFVPGTPSSEREIPEIELLQREFFRRGLRVVGVSVEAGPAALKGFVDRHTLTFVLLTDPSGDAVRAAYGASFPQAYLIDAGGKVQAVYTGSTSWGSEAVKERIKKLLPTQQDPR